MIHVNSRKGSALLIVLGMLAFMVVSAVAFSGYMRFARLPSSYLRRTAASRQLAKAAIARAIDIIDFAIRNDVHPGYSTSGGATWTYRDTGKRWGNVWQGRVFMGTNSWSEVEDTAPVLTLESLAYIPAPLVNEARYYSRRSAAAQWQSFGFDSGRFAFCAIDVSDYFDVNRMVADQGRSSSANRRVSLSYLFEPSNHGSAGSGASEWDSFMGKYRNIDESTGEIDFGGNLPLVSVADLNLALGEETKGNMFSPFCQFLSKSGGGGGFYGQMGPTREDALNRMTFVTDSWFPTHHHKGHDHDKEESGYDEIYELTDPKAQPFTAALLKGAGGPRNKNASSSTILDIMSSGQAGKVRLLDSMPLMSLVALYDYLDGNSVPVTLAGPTSERVPMCCALKPNLTGSIKIRKPTDKEKGAIMDKPKDGVVLRREIPTGQAKRTAYQTFTYYLDGSVLAGLTGGIESLFVYPFARPNDVAPSFKADGRILVFFSPTSDLLKMRTKDVSGGILPITKNIQNDTPGLGANGIINLPIKDMPIKCNETPNSEEDAITPVTLMVNPAVRTALSKTCSTYPLMQITYKWTQTWNSDAKVWTNFEKPDNAEIETAHCGIVPIGEDGNPSKAYQDDGTFTGLLRGGSALAELKVVLQIRVKDTSGNTVDLVPATYVDDNTLNNINNQGAGPQVLKPLCGTGYPLMKFDTGVTIKYHDSEVEKENAIQMNPTAVMVGDPRYNYAPESWFAASSVTPSDWLGSCGRDAGDGDIFMSISDQGYLQSIYELAMLPRLSNLESVGGSPMIGNLETPQDNRPGFRSAGEAKNRGLWWKTFDPFGIYQAAGDDFEGLGFTSGGNGYKVNPYSDSTNVLMAAFANTPLDWSSAATNNPATKDLDAKQFNDDYAWNEYSSGGHLAYNDLEKVAGRFRDAVWNAARSNNEDEEHVLEQAWLNMHFGSGDENELCGFQLNRTKSDKLWCVDKKFLYGFWRDCFEARQQLFLVIVRAEPMMMGGDMVGQVPPQLGARALALVWRDPCAIETTSGAIKGYPHQTRILFYRQLE